MISLKRVVSLCNEAVERYAERSKHSVDIDAGVLFCFPHVMFLM